MSEFEPRQRSRRADRHQQSKPTLEQAFSQAKPLVNSLREQAAPLVDSLKAQPAVPLAMAAVPLLLHFLRIFFGFIYFFPWLFELLCLSSFCLLPFLYLAKGAKEKWMGYLPLPLAAWTAYIFLRTIFSYGFRIYSFGILLSNLLIPLAMIALCLTLALWLFKGRDSLLKPSLILAGALALLYLLSLIISGSNYARGMPFSLVLKYLSSLLLMGLTAYFLLQVIRGEGIQFERRPAAATGARGGKRKSTAALLSFFLGGLGAHRFYLGYKGAGVFQLLGGGVLTTIATLAFYDGLARYNYDAIQLSTVLFVISGLFGIWVIVDFIRILTGSLQPLLGYYEGETPFQDPYQRPSFTPADSAAENSGLARASALRQLETLYQQGILNQEEYLAKVQEVESRFPG